MVSEIVGLVGLVVVTGLIHGAEPGHGWPIAAAYAFDKESVWLQGITASLLLGIGHLVSSIVVVLGFFWVKSAAGLGEVPWLNYVAGGLLILLGIREYVSGGHSHGHDHGGEDGDSHDHDRDGGHSHGHGHDHGEDHDHSHSHHEHEGAATIDDVRNAQDEGLPSDGGHHGHDHGHGHDHDDGHDDGHDHGHGHEHGHGHDHDDGTGIIARLKGAIPFVGGGGHDHDHLTEADAQSKGLWGITWTAFVLGFAHEEEFELIGICTGTNYCVELTFLYAFCVIFALVGMTALLLAGYERYEDRMSEYAEHFPTISAVVLVVMGLGFIAGIF